MIKFLCSAILFSVTFNLSAQKEYVKRENDNILVNYNNEVREIIISKTKEFPNNTQLSIALIQNDKIDYYGIIKQNDSIKFIENQNKIFEIGSITKVLTATVLASLVEEGKIKLTDNINTYYPFAFKNNTQLTFQSLANHTSGLPRLPSNLILLDTSNPYKHYSKIYIENYLRDILEIDEEGINKYTYSNLGFGLISYTLGLSQSRDFEQLLQGRVFDKYHMNHSYTNACSIIKDLVKGQNANGEVTQNWYFNVLFGAGGVLSTTEDLSKFAQAHFNIENKELALTRKPTFNVNENMQIGLGWHIFKSQKGSKLFSHNGGTGGYSSSIIINVSEKRAVIILSNVSAFHQNATSIEQLCFELLSSIF